MERTKTSNHIKALYVCLIVAWILFFIPIPIVSYIIAFPLLFATLVLSIICLTKNYISHGIFGLFAFFLISPIIYLISIGLLFSLISGNNNKYDLFSLFNKEKTVTAPIKETYINPIYIAPPKEEKPKFTYKYLVTLKNGQNFIVDDLTINNEKAVYRDGSMKVSLNSNEISEYKKITIKR